MERFRSEVCSKLKRDYTAGMRIVQPAVCAKCRAVITPLARPFRMGKTHSEHDKPANQQLWDGVEPSPCTLQPSPLPEPCSTPVGMPFGPGPGIGLLCITERLNVQREAVRTRKSPSCAAGLGGVRRNAAARPGASGKKEG